MLPTETKRAKGSLHPERVNRHEPVRPVELPEEPEDMSAEEIKAWRKFGAHVLASRVISADDEAGLEILARVYVRARGFQRQLRNEGPTFKSKSGLIKANPLVKLCRETEMDLRKWLTHFGLTPASRPKVSAAPPPPQERKGTLGEFTKHPPKR